MSKDKCKCDCRAPIIVKFDQDMIDAIREALREVIREERAALNEPPC